MDNRIRTGVLCWEDTASLPQRRTEARLQYSQAFGTAADAPKIESSPTAKYLGVVLEPRRSYWDHVLAVC